jgi:hypothetical protein
MSDRKILTYAKIKTSVCGKYCNTKKQYCKYFRQPWQCILFGILKPIVNKEGSKIVWIPRPYNCIMAEVRAMDGK